MDLNYAISAFVTLFIIVDPIANVPVFVSILANFSAEHRRGMVARAVAIATIVLIAFTLLGGYLLTYLQVEIYSFKVAGGILLFIIALEMLFGRKTATKSSREEEDEAKTREDVVATPLAVPLLAGPGAITAGIVLFDSAAASVDQALLVVDILLVFMCSYIILSKSDYFFKVLGRSGTKVITRIMGLVLSAIAVQFVISGIREALGAAVL